MNREGSVFLWLLLAVPLAIAGLGLSWLVASTAAESYAAHRWVKARAEVIHTELQQRSLGRGNAFGSYRYEIGGAKLEGDRLAISSTAVGLLGDWPADMHEYLSLARDEKRPIMVWVDPDNPASSVVDRELGVGTLLVVLPIALVLDIAALRALGAAFAAWRGGEAPEAAPAHEHQQRDWHFVKILWWIVAFYNAAAWLVAIHVIENVVRDGRVFGYAVVLAPLAGLWIASKTIAVTYRTYRSSP